MRVERTPEGAGAKSFFRLVDDEGRTVGEVDAFLRHLAARGDSPNTLEAYAYDLLRFYRFLDGRGLGAEDFTAALAFEFLAHLRASPSRNRRAQRLSPALVADQGGTKGGGHPPPCWRRPPSTARSLASRPSSSS